MAIFERDSWAELKFGGSVYFPCTYLGVLCFVFCVLCFVLSLAYGFAFCVLRPVVVFRG